MVACLDSVKTHFGLHRVNLDDRFDMLLSIEYPCVSIKKVNSK
ncbi:hypothetical protein SAMN03080601_00424 [Alkalitalea saponilacus]|uniref:Uncharacterized protein n=1 Tax=Alkalitalea saponilacus TaxID=889453 RepID=A0A1T5AYC1_9BACT|nr:hypothetical protein SAMN03080601_00424 [Alkalitalea saponilacus]